MKKKRRFIVKCTLKIPIEVDEDYYDDDFTPEFDIEENHCPGTGIVGSAFERIKIEHDKNNTCWACAMKGENEIIEDEII